MTQPAHDLREQLCQVLADELSELRDRDLLRRLTTIDEVRGASVRVGPQWLVSWCTNDYLGLSTDSRVIRAACEAAQRWGVGARASRLLAGSTSLHARLEERLAAFFRAEAAVVFPSGYLTNLGALSAVLGAGDLVFVDRLAHASLIDACRASRAMVRVFHHNDVEQLGQLLVRYTRARRRLVVTEGVFSMDGDRAPLAPLLETVQRHQAWLYLDDAHGAFVLGERGRGSAEAIGALGHGAMIYMGTLGKALGCQGGFVVGPRALIETIHNRARTFIYATALATPVVSAALEALRIVDEDPAARAQLLQNIQLLHARFMASSCHPLQVLRTREPSHIVPVIAGESGRALELAADLWQRGMFAPAIRPPTVPNGTARLRISLSALHTEDHISQLAAALGELLQSES